MRFELAGSLIHPDPLVVRFDASGSFDTVAFKELGYTHFEVICIGGGGGAGGGIDTNNTGTLIRNYGGAGGGGGFQRVRGLLSALPDTCAVVVGAAGAHGNDHASNPALTTDGSDGGFSTFNAITCRASAGKGGKRAQTNSATVTTHADGGEGGIGNRTIAGGGSAGGIAGTPTALGPGTPGVAGVDGTLFNNIGKGGGGGAGGVGKWGAIVCNPATAGGRGSFNPGDTAVYGPAGLPTDDTDSLAVDIVPGFASGAKASPLNGLPYVYGKSGAPGIVVALLTANVVAAIGAPVTPPGGTTLFGRTHLPIVFGKSVGPHAKIFGKVLMPITFGKDVTSRLPGAYGAGGYGDGIYYGLGSKQTPVAEISLASHAAPAVRNRHTIKFRARTTSGSGAVMYAALFEGTTNRSGILVTGALTTSFADYTLTIPDVGAASITSYSNLSIKIWGYDPSGAGLVFQIARLTLNLPSA